MYTNTTDDTNRDNVVGVTDLRLKFAGEPSFVFKDMTWHAKRGEKVLLLGPSGCGKSTLLQVLSGIIPRLLEVPLKYAECNVPTSWGFVFQDPDTQFCMPYVDEELAFVLENLQVPRMEMQSRMEEVLEQVGLSISNFHVKIDTLSQGMKQRLALATVLLLEPEVIFLDEPSALLDPVGRRQIWEAVDNIARDRTLIIVEHRIEEILSIVTRVVLFDDVGSIIADGEPSAVFSKFRKELQTYGIWYPEVWDHYFQTETGMKSIVQASSLPSDRIEPVIELEQYEVLRQGKSMVKVDHAKVYPGDFIAITGDNGAGKSTLLLGLMSLLKSEGHYRLHGESVGTKQRKKVASTPMEHIGFVFQNPEFQFVTDSVLKEVAFSLYEDGLPQHEVDRLCEQVLRQFNLTGLESRHPYQLSLGQKRRLSVATAIVRGKSVLLLDEPTFGQDAANTFAILGLCEHIRQKGTAIVMVTHETQIARKIATHQWTMQGGTVVTQQITERGRAMQRIEERIEESIEGVHV